MQKKVDEPCNLTPLEIANSGGKNSAQARKQIESNVSVYQIVSKMIEVYFQAGHIEKGEYNYFEKEKENLMKAEKIKKFLPPD